MRIIARVLTAAALVAATSCSAAVRSSTSPVILVIDSLQAFRGSASTATAASTLTSDVLTIVTTGGTCTTSNPCPTVFGDSGQATLHEVLKDIGLPGTTPTPTTNNQVTITNVHIAYRRTDGRNQEGVDVPYSFDTAATAAITGTGNVTIGFPLVRVQAKEEPPLVQLVTNGQVLSMIIDVTLSGQDVAGNNLSVTGSIAVDFGNFGDQ